MLNSFLEGSLCGVSCQVPQCCDMPFVIKTPPHTVPPSHDSYLLSNIRHLISQDISCQSRPSLFWSGAIRDEDAALINRIERCCPCDVCAVSFYPCRDAVSSWLVFQSTDTGVTVGVCPQELFGGGVLLKVIIVFFNLMKLFAGQVVCPKGPEHGYRVVNIIIARNCTEERAHVVCCEKRLRTKHRWGDVYYRSQH